MWFRLLLEIVLLVLIQQNVIRCLESTADGCTLKEDDNAVPQLPIVDPRCGVSVAMGLEPMPKEKRMSVSVSFTFDASVAKKQPRMTLLLMYDEHNTGVTSCADPNVSNEKDGRLLKQIKPAWELDHVFRRNVTTSARTTYTSSLDCVHPELLLQPGNYCVYLEIYDLPLCQPLATTMYELKKDVLVEAAPSLLGDDATLPFTYLIAIVVSLSIVFLGAIIFFLIKRGLVNRLIPILPVTGDSRTWNNVIKEMLSKPEVPVFLLYFPDCPHHVEVVEKLAAFLNCNRCSVSFDAIEKDSVARNPAGWLEQKLKGDAKIVIVGSRGAFESQRTWMNRVKCGGPTPFTTDGLFLMALANIMTNPNMAFDYSKVYMLRPKYVPREQLLSGITTNRHFDMPGDLSQLVLHLHNLGSYWASEKGGEKWEHCHLEYDRLSGAVASLTEAADDQPAAIDGSVRCRQCAPQTPESPQPSDVLLGGLSLPVEMV